MQLTGSISDIMKEVDGKYPSPNQRAAKVYNVLRLHAPDLDTWDIACFATEMLGVLALDPSFASVIGETVKSLNKQIYLAHYLCARELFGESTIQPPATPGGSSTEANVSSGEVSTPTQDAEGSSIRERANSEGNATGRSKSDDGEDSKGSAAKKSEREADGNVGNDKGD